MGTAVAKAFKQLLSEKHLYQLVEVEKDFIPQAVRDVHFELIVKTKQPFAPDKARQPPLTIDAITAQAEKIVANELWLPREFTPTTLRFSQDSYFVHVDLPTINTFCEHCDARWPFNPVSEGSYVVQGDGQDEFFYLGYQCQQCKGVPIRFLVRREGLRLRLAGRYPIEVLPTPKELPKTVSKYFGNALIAHHAGQTLAGLFLLRVFIEQFWRTVPEVRELVTIQPKATGDEQGDTYQGTLPQDFKSRFPSLKEIYGNLSAAIHSADGNAKLFDDSCAKNY